MPDPTLDTPHPDHGSQPPSFHTLHAITHERDFVVRTNDVIQSFARRILAETVADLARNPRIGCPACAAGFDPFHLQPSVDDR